MSTASATVRAGICGFTTRVRAEADEEYQVKLTVESDCEKVRAYGLKLSEQMPLSALDELGLGSDGVILSTARRHLKGCCSACVTCDGVFKAMQVAAGLALPAPVQIELELQE
jgi:hypothetical protein